MKSHIFLGHLQKYLSRKIDLKTDNFIDVSADEIYNYVLPLIFSSYAFNHQDEKGGMLCSFLKKLAGSTSVFMRTSLSKLFLKYFLPQMLACL